MATGQKSGPGPGRIGSDYRFRTASPLSFDVHLGCWPWPSIVAGLGHVGAPMVVAVVFLANRFALLALLRHRRRTVVSSCEWR